MVSYIRKHSWFLLSVTGIYFAVYIFFFRLGVAPLQDWDEAWYAEMTKQMIRTGNLFVLYWNGEVLLDKPPLLIWLNSIAVSLLGFSEFSFRFVPAFTGFLTVLIITFFAYTRWGLISSIFVYFSLILNSLFIWRGRSGNIDSLLTFLFVLCFLLISAKSTFRYKYILLGIVFGLIFLTKLTIVLLPIGIFVLHEFFYKRAEIRNRVKDYGMLALFAIGLPFVWLLGGFLDQGTQFITYYLFNADQGVMTVAFENFKLNYWYHTYYALQRRLFWFFLLGIILLLLRIKDRVHFLILLFSISLLVLLSFTKRDNNWYLLPAIPFWSLTVGYSIFEIQRRVEKVSKRLSFVSAGVLILFILAISYRTFTVNISPILNAKHSKSLVQSSLYIRNHSKLYEVIIRLDESYPSAIFYTDRKVLSTATSGIKSSNMFITLDDLQKKIEAKEVTWLYGSREKVSQFLDRYPQFSFGQISINSEEVILKKIYLY